MYVLLLLSTFTTSSTKRISTAVESRRVEGREGGKGAKGVNIGSGFACVNTSGSTYINYTRMSEEPKGKEERRRATTQGERRKEKQTPTQEKKRKEGKLSIKSTERPIHPCQCCLYSFVTVGSTQNRSTR